LQGKGFYLPCPHTSRRHGEEEKAAEEVRQGRYRYGSQGREGRPGQGASGAESRQAQAEEEGPPGKKKIIGFSSDRENDRRGR